MKKMKKLIAVLLAAVMILGMNLNVFATEPSPQATTGSISISNPLPGKFYDVYLLFELESASGDAYLYKVTDAWKEFVKSDSVGSAYLELYNGEYVRVKRVETTEGKFEELELSDLQKVELAKAAIEYAKSKANDAENPITKVATLPRTLDDGSTSYTISDLPLGYYAVDSTAGALCSLNTVNPNAPIREKNQQPTIDKQVLEDVNNNGKIDSEDTWGSINDDEAGDTIFYKTKITAKPGAHEYILHDRMGEGLTLNSDSIQIWVDKNQLDPYLLEETDTDVTAKEKAETAKKDYYILYNHASETLNTEVCDFEVHFTEYFLKTIQADTIIEVRYNAELNEHAYIYEEGNINATKLEYGEGNSTEVIKTYTYTYMFDVIKTDDHNKVIYGAKFELYRADENGEKELTIDRDGTKVNVTAESNPVKLISKGNETYMVADLEATNNIVTSFNAGYITVKGLDVGTYYLVETEAPAGYNKLDHAIEITFTRDEKTYQSENIMGTVLNGVYVEKSGGIQVINQTGTLLPETGGTGRVILYSAGSIFTIAAIVAIVTKRRMKYEK